MNKFPPDPVDPGLLLLYNAVAHGLLRMSFGMCRYDCRLIIRGEWLGQKMSFVIW